MSYDFDTLMNEAYTYLETDKPANNTHLILPKIIYESNNIRLIWKNVNEFLNVINRQADHFINFIKTEYIDKEFSFIPEGLIIHGKYLKQQFIYDIAIKYVNMYVSCSVCKSINTKLIKSSKMYNFECLDCSHTKNM